MFFAIACPTSNERVHRGTVETLSRLQIWLAELGHDSALRVQPATRLDRARNLIATQFLESEAETLICIDSGIAARREAFEAMLASQADCVAAEIPARVDGLDAFAQGVRSGLSNAEAQRRAAMGPDAGAEPEIRAASSVDTRFFMLRRGILEALVARGVVPRRLDVFTASSAETYGFFAPLLLADGSRLSGAASFCRRIRSAGGSLCAYRGPGVVRVCEIGFSS